MSRSVPGSASGADLTDHDRVGRRCRHALRFDGHGECRESGKIAVQCHHVHGRSAGSERPDVHRSGRPDEPQLVEPIGGQRGFKAVLAGEVRKSGSKRVIIAPKGLVFEGRTLAVR